MFFSLSKLQRRWLVVCSLVLCVSAFAPDRRFSYPSGERDLLSPQWQRDFVRQPANYFNSRSSLRCAILQSKMLHLDAQYLRNHSSALMGFYDWYLGNRSGDFIEMIKAEHRASCLGQDGRTPYMRVYEGGGYESSDAHPGTLREELPPTVPRYTYDKFSLSPEELALVQGLGQNWAVAFRDRPSDFRQAKQRIDVRDIPADSRPELTIIFDGRVERGTPTGNHEREFRRAVAARMEDLRGWRERTHSDVVKDLDKFLSDLADYYHTGIHWMPFSMVNNSIFMGQVNVMLRHFGFHTIPHDGLDYLALSTDHAVFRRIFRTAFLNENPQ